MSENNYGALMMKSALSANVDIDSVLQPGIYPVPSGNTSSPDPNGGTLLFIQTLPSVGFLLPIASLLHLQAITHC